MSMLWLLLMCAILVDTSHLAHIRATIISYKPHDICITIISLTLPSSLASNNLLHVSSQLFRSFHQELIYEQISRSKLPGLCLKVRITATHNTAWYCHSVRLTYFPSPLAHSAVTHAQDWKMWALDTCTETALKPTSLRKYSVTVKYMCYP
jgi:hypothetical protein